MRQDRVGFKIPTRRFLRMCRRSMRRSKVADSLGMELTGAGLLTRALTFRRMLTREVLTGADKNVGLLLPPSVPAVLANAALLLDRRVPVNLNYTVSSEMLNDCIAQAGIRHVLTSRRVMERFDTSSSTPSWSTWRTSRTRSRGPTSWSAALQAWLVPVTILERWLGLTQIDPDDLLTIIFTSGSTGEPKGVMLTHRNVGSNVEAFNQALRLTAADTLIGILPFFHSFGYTATLWAVLMLDPKVVYHFNPLDARQVGKLCRKHRATILIATPTFLRSYLRAVRAGGFRHAGGGGDRRGEAAARSGRRVREEVRRAARRRLRHHGALAGGLRQHPAQPLARRPRRPMEGGHRRPADPRRPGQGRRPGDRRGPRARQVGHAAGQGPQRDEGLPRRAREDRRSDPRRLVRDRRHRR